MTSEERHERRYQRRCEQRRRKRANKNPHIDCYEAVFSFKHLWDAYKHCRKGVRWKGSVQRYIFDAPLRTVRVHRKLMQGKYKCAIPHEWDTWERGKKRHIKSVPIGERVVQRCLADNCLLPTLEPMFIYDNGACMKKKGYDFAMNRLDAHLHRYYRKYGSEGYVLLFDFEKFYDNVSHVVLRDILNKRLCDQRILKMVDDILATFGPIGLGLGSQISQVLALASANELDHFVKQNLGVEYYARYNDDGYLIHQSKEYLQDCLEKMKLICASLHIKISPKKTHIMKLSRFKFLKARIYLTKTGKVVRKIAKERITIERRKLKKLKKKLDAGVVDMQHIEMAYQSWRGFAKRYFNSWHTVRNMDKLYYSLYPNSAIIC